MAPRPSLMACKTGARSSRADCESASTRHARRARVRFRDMAARASIRSRLPCIPSTLQITPGISSWHSLDRDLRMQCSWIKSSCHNNYSRAPFVLLTCTRIQQLLSVSASQTRGHSTGFDLSHFVCNVNTHSDGSNAALPLAVAMSWCMQVGTP